MSNVLRAVLIAFSLLLTPFAFAGNAELLTESTATKATNQSEWCTEISQFEDGKSNETLGNNYAEEIKLTDLVQLANIRCGVKPVPPVGCKIGACVCDQSGNCSWTFICS